MPKLKVTMPETGEVTHELVDELITVGRISENSLQIEDGSVSSRHAQLTLGANGNYALKDLNSTNGTRVNGAPTTDAQLRNGDRVRFGQIECAYFSDTTSQNEPLPAAAAPDAHIPAESRRPTNFANASPFQKKNRAKDPAGLYILIFAGLAVLLFLVALGFVFTLQPPAP